MRVTIAALGLELDVTFGPASDAPEDDPQASMDGGTTAAYPMGFTATHEMPDEAAIHHQCSPYEDDSEARR